MRLTDKATVSDGFKVALVRKSSLEFEQVNLSLAVEIGPRTISYHFNIAETLTGKDILNQTKSVNLLVARGDPRWPTM